MDFLYIFDTDSFLKVKKNPFFRKKASYLVILCYIRKKPMSKIQAKKISLKFIPYFFVAVATLTAFGSNSGTWV